MGRTRELYNLLIWLILMNAPISAQINSFTVKLGASYNQTYAIFPNIYDSETIYGANKYLAVDLSLGERSKVFNTSVELGWTSSKCIFPQDLIPFIGDIKQNRPYYSMDRFFSNIKLNGTLVQKRIYSMQIEVGIGLGYQYHPSGVLILPSGATPLYLDGERREFDLEWSYSNLRSEIRSWTVGFVYGINQVFSLNETWGINVSLGGMMSAFDWLQHRVDYRVRRPIGSGIESYMDLKNSGSFFFSTLGIVYSI